MNHCFKNKLILNALIIILLISCSSVDKTDIEEQSIFNIDIPDRKKDTYMKIINDFYNYNDALEAIDKNDYFAALNFLSNQQSPNSMTETLRLKLLKNLGENNNSDLFLTEFAKLPKEVLNEETLCYYYLFNTTNSKDKINKIKQLASTNENISNGCLKLYNYASVNGLINNEDIWRRIWILLYYDKVYNARLLAKTINDPLPEKLGSFKYGTNGEKAGLMYLVISPKNRNKNISTINKTLNNIATKLDYNQLSFVHGILGISNAKDLNMNEALFHYKQAKARYMSYEQWQWLARALLRLNNWQKLNTAINKMPKEISNTSTWKYWKAKSIEHIENKKNNLANALYNQVSKSGRNFYAVLANEELGKNLNIKDNVPKVSIEDMNKIAQDGAIDRALVLFKESEILSDIKMRIAAQNQWKYAVRNYNEYMLIVAAQLAFENNFYEMAIYSAERTNNKLNFGLRYLSIYKDIVTKYSNIYGINKSWAMGIIRQESRFMNLAKSWTGALGLMQIMPSTAKFIANKIGLNYYDAYNIDTNINMGIWYLAYIFEDVNSYVLATAGYNAGKNNAKKWQDYKNLDATIYIETIPYNETRTYVKKVMTNSVYYANLFYENKKTLKSFLEYIPAKQ